VLLLFAGHETTAGLLANGTLALLRHDRWTYLAEHDDEIPDAVEELLRYEAPTQFITRVAGPDCVIGGVTVQPGSTVNVGLGAANRDADRFPDPDRLDFHRPNRHDIAFGYGAHYCLGAALARLEGTIALRTMTARYPHMRLQPVPLRWRDNLILRGVEELPVVLVP
jgi:cytochrome P450